MASPAGLDADYNVSEAFVFPEPIMVTLPEASRRRGLPSEALLEFFMIGRRLGFSPPDAVDWQAGSAPPDRFCEPSFEVIALETIDPGLGGIRLTVDFARVPVQGERTVNLANAVAKCLVPEAVTVGDGMPFITFSEEPLCLLEGAMDMPAAEHDVPQEVALGSCILASSLQVLEDMGQPVVDGLFNNDPMRTLG